MMPSSFVELIGARLLARDQLAGPAHIVDQLIAERAIGLSSHPLWPIMRPVLYRFLHYSEAVRMADEIAPLPGWEVLEHISRLLALETQVSGLEHLPRKGCCILACSHPTGIADGIAVFDMLKGVRRDVAIFANRDALRVSARLGDILIPVEWRAGEKSHSKSRDTLEHTARAFADERAVVLFPSGRIAFWNGDRLAERPWQSSLVALARRYSVPVIPVNVSSRNSPLFYFVSKKSTELRDMTVFHELLNKKGKVFSLTIGKPIAPEALEGDVAEVTQRLQDHTVLKLREDPLAEFAPLGHSSELI
jgi:putative hemolysin